MKHFIYDVKKLIQLVKDRPCLWDKTAENYRDREERRKTWTEIYKILEERYDIMTPEEQLFVAEKITDKWTNVRDTFVRTIKCKTNRTRKYLLYNELKFLLKVISTDEDNCNYVEEANSSDYVNYSKSARYFEEDCRVSDVEDDIIEYDHEKAVKEEKPKRKRVKKETAEDPPAIDFVEVGGNIMNDSRVMNEDEAFFASLLPTVVKYNEDERLEFRIEVLAAMKRIKNKGPFL